MPIINEEIPSVKEYIEQIPKNLTEGELSDVWLVIAIAAAVYLGSGFVSLALKLCAGVVVLLGLFTVFQTYFN
jgi:hypothetical protein